MVHIHYTQGPPALADISKELFDEIVICIHENYSDEDIMDLYPVSKNVIESIYDVLRKGFKRCCFCGKLFISSSPRKINCDDEHYLPCVGCGTPVKVKESYSMYMKAGGRRCPVCRGKQIGLTRKSKSPEEKAAIVAKQQSTMIERYGAATALQVPEMKAKIQATVKSKYGVDNLSQSKEIQQKIRENSQAKYGVDHYSNAPEIRKKMTDGMLAKFGYTNAQQCPELQEKTKQTNLERYGVENVFQNAEVRQHYVDNHTARYGVAWPHQRLDLIEQVKQANIEKYGAPMYPISDNYMRTVISNPEKFENYKAFMKDPERFIREHYSEKPSVVQICEDTGITDTTVYDKLIAIGRRDLATEFCYSMETQLIEIIRRLSPDVVIEKHNRSILDRQEIDVYLPELKVGFECNPTYTHNSSFRDPWGELPKGYRYHADKSKLAREKGVFLFHIFGYEWKCRRDQIVSQIQNILGCNTRKEYARKCKIVNVSYSDSMKFLNENHRQGGASSSIRLGLADKETGELLSLMTFGKMRTGIGKRRDQSENDWELIRFCNLRSTSVTGAASRLLKHFVVNYKPSKVVSFSDLAHTRGKIYSTLGFKEISTSDPGYVWVKLKDDSYYTRISCQKSNLPKLFNDVTLEDIATMTEREIMMKHGYAKVYDSGVIRWEYTQNAE